ncbi:hypothetical protein Tco_1417966 [Tanacetum coccineum]
MCENLFVCLDVYEMHLILNNDAVGGSRLSCIMMQELKPFTPARVTKVPHVSTFLGKTGSVGLEVLDTLGNSMTNLNANSGFILKKEILHSERVQLLLSTDTEELLRIAASDKREELEVFSQEVVRFGDMCKDPQWHNLDRLFARLDLEMVTSTHLREEAEITTQDLTNLAQYMSVLMDFPQLTMTLPDRSEESVMKRTTLVANTSNLWLLVRLQYIQVGSVIGEVGLGKSSLLNSVLVLGSDLVLLDDSLVISNSSRSDNVSSFLRFTKEKIQKFSFGSPPPVGGGKIIFVKLFGDEKDGNTFWLDSSSTEKVYLLLLNYGYPYW